MCESHLVLTYGITLDIRVIVWLGRYLLTLVKMIVLTELDCSIKYIECIQQSYWQLALCKAVDYML